jgi:hypothetical protein
MNGQVDEEIADQTRTSSLPHCAQSLPEPNDSGREALPCPVDDQGQQIEKSGSLTNCDAHARRPLLRLPRP